MTHKEEDEATSLYILYMVYMKITQTRCTMALFITILGFWDFGILGEIRCRRRPPTSGSRPRGRNLVPAQNAKSDPI